MIRPRPPHLAAVQTMVLAAALAGCGGGGSHSTPATSSPAPTRSTPPPSSGASHTAGHRAPRPASPTGGTPAPPSGQAGSQAGGPEAAAIATVNQHGFTVTDRSQYHQAQTLRVLIGVGHDASGQRVEQAFFFVVGRWIGTDARAPSGSVSVGAQSDTAVTLVYGLYRPGDAQCCPGGGRRSVRFELNNGRLGPLDPIPPSTPGTGLSRR